MPMLPALRARAGERKLRLFAVACCGRIREGMADERCRRAAELAERFADGQADPSDLARASAEAAEASNEASDRGDGVGCDAAAVAMFAAYRDGRPYFPCVPYV